MSNIQNNQNFINLPTCSAVPSSGSQLINKTYGDGTYGLITGANVWSGAANTFNANPLFPTGAIVGYSPVCTNATTGAWTWQQDLGFQQVTLTTTNNTPTNIPILTMSTPSTSTLIIYVSAANAAYTDSTGGMALLNMFNTSGTATQSSNPLIGISATTTGTFSIVQAGTVVSLQVTGLASTTYNWKINYMIITN